MGRPKESLDKLSPRQEEFATGLAAGLSQSEAYKRAYPKAVHWKPETVGPKACRLAGMDKIRARVAFLTRKAADSNEVTVERIVRELARIAFGTKRSVMAWGPDGVRLRDSDTLSDDEAAMVAEVSETKSVAGGSLKLKTHDKVKALELLGRHVGMFVDKVEMTGKDGEAIMPARIELVAPDVKRTD